MLEVKQTIIKNVKNNDTIILDNISFDCIQKGNICTFTEYVSEHQAPIEITGSVVRIEHVIKKLYHSDTCIHKFYIYIY